MPFFQFDQNNSGGGFDIDQNVAPIVVIEAADADDAQDKALVLGIYFDGVNEGRDCECCGDRWYSPEEGKETFDEEAILKEWGWRKRSVQQGEAYAIVHFANGSKTIFTRQD
jgi:hypothetical protein